jgi:hypothetical protein
MRIATGLGATALVVLGGSVIGLLGPWALGVGALLMLLAAVVAATALESRELSARLADARTPPPSVLRRAA